jgi:hypothetical protein
VTKDVHILPIALALGSDDIRDMSKIKDALNELYAKLEATSIQYDFNKDVEIRHPPTLKDGAAELAKRGTIKFTYYYDSSEH